MKRKDLEQLKEKNIEALRKQAQESYVKILKGKAEFLTGREKNVRALKVERIKRAIALTLAREKELKGVKA